MSDDNDMLSPIVQSAIRDAQKALGTYEEFGVLGDEVGRINGGLPQNRVWVRKIISDGQYSKAYIAIAHTHKTGAYMVYAGSPVVLGYVNRELAVMGQNHKTTESLGYNPAVLNTGDASLQGVATTDLLPLLCHAVGTSATPSTKVGVKTFRYYTVENETGWYTGSVSSQVDLASVIPTAGNHAYACIFFNTSDQTFTVVASTPKVLAIPLSDADKQECFNGMPPYSIPVAMWRLQNGQTAVTQADFVEDLRPLYGQGTARQNLSASIAPTVTDDEDSGYGVGSVWIDSGTDVYINTDPTAGASVWLQLSTGGGFTDFTIAGDSGTPQVIASGDTVTFEGTGGITTVASATNIIEVDGSAFVQSFNVEGDSGTPQVISNGDDFAILGGGGVKTIAENTDTIRVFDSWDYTDTKGSSGAFDITLASISTWDSTVTQIIMQLVLRSTASGTADFVYAFFNNSTTITNYTRQAAGGQAGAAAVATANDPLINICPANGSPASSFGLQTVNIMLPNDTGILKGFHNLGGSRLDTGNNLRVDNIFSIWNSANAITSLQIRTDNHPTDLFATGSSIRLRFIK